MAAKKNHYFHDASSVLVKATDKQFRDKLEPAGFVLVESEEDLGDIETELELKNADDVDAAVSLAQEEQGDDGSGDAGASAGGSEVESDDSGDSGSRETSPDDPASASVSGDDGSGSEPAADSGEDGESGVGSEGDGADQAPDPNNYRHADDRGFVNNTAAGGAVPGGRFSQEFVNGVSNEGDEG